MIFSEIYSVYFRTLEKLIAKATEGRLDAKTFYETATENAFSESAVFIENAIKNGEWKIIDESWGTPYEFVPQTPLTELEKRWIKTITLDQKFLLFAEREPLWLKDVKPLFSPRDILWPDRYAEGDDYGDENYRGIFRIILQALKESKKLQIEYTSGKGHFHRGEFIPRRLEYSSKEDKFRLYTGNVFKNNIINLGRISKCRLGEKFNQETLLPLKIQKDEVQFEIINRRNCLERALIHFSSFEKETVKLDGDRFLVKMKYVRNDETEIVVRLLQFGQFVKVIAPEYMVNQMKTRIFAQKKLWNE